jgi:parallel beta-helix repeat protein
MFLIAMGGGAVLGQIIYVDADANGLNDGSRWADAYEYLQDALAVAVYGDEIWVARGIYKPDQGVGITLGDRTDTLQLINGVAIKGGYAGLGEPDPNARDIELYETTLSGDLDGNDIDVSDPCDLLTEPSRAENSYHVVTSSGTDATAVLDGFMVTAGNADASSPVRYGGGMYNESGNPTLTNCTFSGNSARYGGGMYNINSSPTVTNCTFTGNNGDGMYNSNSSPTVTNCTFSGNNGRGMYSYRGTPTVTNCTFTGNNGGGMHNSNSSPTVTNCSFIGNTAESGGGIDYTFGGGKVTNCTFSGNTAKFGGGMDNGWNSGPKVVNCIFTGNSADAGGAIFNISPHLLTVFNCTFIGNSANLYGGGMFNESSQPTVTNCTFTANSAEYDGGGMYTSSSYLTVNNCTFTGNSANMDGGGMYNINNSPTVTNCTFSGNSANSSNGGGMYNHTSSPTVTNCIFWGDEPDEIEDGTESSSTVNYCDVQGGTGRSWFGTGCIDTDPCFVDADGTDDIVGTEDDNLRLSAVSPCIDAGDPNYPYDPNETDLDGLPRFVDGDCNDTDIVDMGGYEFLRSDIDRNGSVDMVDFSRFALYWRNSGCNECGGADLTCDGNVDFNDLRELFAYWLAGVE